MIKNKTLSESILKKKPKSKNGRKGKSSEEPRSSLDIGILIALLFLCGIGLVQVYSSSFILATEKYGNGLFFFSKQFVFTFLAIFVLFITAFFPWSVFRKWGVYLWWAAGVGIVATFVPSIVIKAGGAARWIKLPGGMRFEPSELLKISFCVILATFLSRKSEWMGKFELWLKPFAILIPLVLLLKQPDFGSFAICLIVGLTVAFAFGLQWRYIFVGVSTALPAIYFLIMNSPYRKARVLAFLDPWADPAKKGFQVIQSLLSFHSGGVTGVGLGQSQGKLFFLPEAHTDFTLAVLGEEMGFVGYLFIMLLFGYLIFRGLQIAVKASDKFDKVLALGLTITFSCSVFINIGVVLGVLPPKGLALPFLSYGGSSLVMNAFLFGLLLNIERQFIEEPNTGRRFYQISYHNDPKSLKKKR